MCKSQATFDFGGWGQRALNVRMLFLVKISAGGYGLNVTQCQGCADNDEITFRNVGSRKPSFKSRGLKHKLFENVDKIVVVFVLIRIRVLYVIRTIPFAL